MDTLWWLAAPLAVLIAGGIWWAGTRSRRPGARVLSPTGLVDRQASRPVPVSAPRTSPSWLVSTSRPAGLVLSGPEGTLVEFTPLRPSGDGRATGLPPEVARVLAPLVERLPALAENTRQVLGDSYRVVLKPEFLEGVRDGSFTMMTSREVADGFRLNVVDKAGKVVGQGTNVPVGKALQLASAGFQVATFVTAQAHLAQINARLEEIQTTLADVLAHLQDGQEGELQGKMDYLRGVAAELQLRPLSPEEVVVYHGQLETVERETLEVARAIELELTRRGERVDALRLDEWMTTSKHDAGSLTKALDQYQQTARRYELTLWVRLATLQLKAALPHPPAMVAARRRDVLESVKQFESLNAQVRERVLARADEVTGAFTTEQSLLERRQALKAAAAERTGPIQESVHAMREAADAPSQIEARRSRVERDGLTLDIRRKASGELDVSVSHPTD